MTLTRLLLCITFSLAIACGDDSSPDAGASADTGDIQVDAAGSVDTGSTDTGTDVVSDVATGDAGALEDAAVDTGTDAAAADAALDSGPGDAGSACETRVEDRVAGVCDGMGMQICTNWASENGGMNAVAECTRPEGRCARADTCTEEGCLCGTEAECGAAEMCVSGIAGFSCVCISPRTDPEM